MIQHRRSVIYGISCMMYHIWSIICEWYIRLHATANIDQQLWMCYLACELFPHLLSLSIFSGDGKQPSVDWSSMESYLRSIHIPTRLAQKIAQVSTFWGASQEAQKQLKMRGNQLKMKGNQLKITGRLLKMKGIDWKWKGLTWKGKGFENENKSDWFLKF